MLSAPERQANANRSNLTAFSPGDTVYVAHQRMAPGRLHQAVVSKVVNASVSFTPPIPQDALLNDPANPDAGNLQLPQPLASITTAACTPQLGTASAAALVTGDDGSLSLRYQHPSGDTITRTIPPARTRLGDLEAFLLEQEGGGTGPLEAAAA